jgi:hypothetical protein
MSGLKRRLTRRRSAGPEGSEPTAAAPGPGTTPNQPPAEEAPTSLLSDPAAQPAQVQPPAPFSAGQPAPGAPYSHLDPAAPPAEPSADLPPGLDPDELAAVPTTSARRGRLRRRVAFLRAARELLLRDLGGFVYEIHRTAGDHEHEAHRRLRATKLERLTRVDAELHELELLLDDVRRNVVVSEPGVGGECPECGELFGSAAHYCSHCGLPLTESARRAFSRIVAAQPAAAEAPAAPAPVQEDQPTRPLPAVAAQPGTEFHWPPREGTAPAGEAGTRGDVAAGGEAAAARDDAATRDDVAPGGEAAAARDDAAARGDVAPGGNDAAARDDAATRGDVAPGGNDAAARDDAASRDDVAPGGDDAARRADVPAGGDVPADGGVPAAGDPATLGDSPAGDEAPTRADVRAGDDPATRGDDANAAGGDATASGGDAPKRDERAPGGQDAKPADDAPNGREPGTLFSRAERGT